MHDCLIVGAGPAGLTAATYLGRFLRRVTIVDAGGSRMLRIPKSRNVPGFPDGIEGKVLLSRMIEQAAQYGTTFVQGTVQSLEVAAGGFVARTSAGEMHAQTVLLAAGVEVVDPPIADLEEAIARGRVRYCPICDGYEARGNKIAVLGGRPSSIEEARFLRTYSDAVTFVPASERFVVLGEEREVAEAQGITLLPESPSRIHTDDDGVQIQLDNGRSERFDTLYPCLGARPRSELAAALGATTSQGGGVVTDGHQMTDVEGLYAAGDVLEGLDQIASACGQGAIAATAIHNRLRELIP